MSYVGDRAAARPTRFVVGREVGVHQIAGHVGTVLRCALGVVDGKLNLVAESLQLLVGHRAGVDVVGHIHHVVTQWLTCRLVEVLVGSHVVGLLTQILILLPERDVQLDVSSSSLCGSNGSLNGILAGSFSQGSLGSGESIEVALRVDNILAQVAVVGQGRGEAGSQCLVGIVACTHVDQSPVVVDDPVAIHALRVLQTDGDGAVGISLEEHHVVVAACGKVAGSRVHVVGNPDRSALSGLHFHLATLANLLAGTLVSGYDGLAGAVGARVGIHLDIVDLSVLVGVGGVSRAVAPTRTIECLQAQHVDTLQQAGHALVCIEYGLVELSVGVALETRCRTLPVVVLVVVVAGVLDEQRGDIDGVLSGSVSIVALSLLLLALLDGFLSAGDGSVQLFERAGSVVVDGSLGGHVGTDFLSLVQHFLQLHGSIVDGYGAVEVGNVDSAYCSEPLLVNGLLDHLPLRTRLLGTNQVQAAVGELTLPAQELVGLGGQV